MLKSGFRQLTFVFADSPIGGGDEAPADVSAGKTYLLHTADVKGTINPTASLNPGLLLDQVACESNLAQALLNVARNDGAAGVDEISVADVVASAAHLLPRLRQSLLSGDYRPGDIRRVWIPKPGGGQRGLGIPNVVDRWVQQAVLQVLQPIFEPLFHHSSHGFRPGRGAGSALQEAKSYLREGYSITVDVDLSNFFDRVHHQRLLSRLGQQVTDGRVLQLVSHLLRVGTVLPDGSRVVNESGVPQGGPLSPLLSNVVLDELDWELDRRGLRFVRYADDFSVFVRSERAGHRVKSSVTRFLRDRLRLEVNEKKSSVSGPYDLTLLGFHLGRPAGNHVPVTLPRSTRRRLDTRLRELTPRMWGGSLSSCLKQVSRYLRGWLGYYRRCTREALAQFQRADAHVRRRIRAVVVRQKKRRRFLYRHLRRQGASHRAARNSAFNRRGTWHSSRTSGMHRVYSNAWFADRLYSLGVSWMDLNPPDEVSFKQLSLFGEAAT